jgi:hypothetical protein
MHHLPRRHGIRRPHRLARRVARSPRREGAIAGYELGRLRSRGDGHHSYRAVYREPVAGEAVPWVTRARAPELR